MPWLQAGHHECCGPSSLHFRRHSCHCPIGPRRRCKDGISPDRENDTTYDKIYGTDTPRAVGSEWAVNKAEMIKSKGEGRIQYTEKDISGKTKLASVQVIDGKEYCMVRAEVKINPSGFKGEGMTLNPSKSVMSVKLEALAPVDATSHFGSAKEISEMTLMGTFNSPGGEGLTEMHGRGEKQAEYKPVK